MEKGGSGNKTSSCYNYIYCFLRGTLGSVAFLLSATLYQENPDRNNKLWNIVSTERYILHMQVLLESYYI
jgi:hypothetical protein